LSEELKQAPEAEEEEGSEQGTTATTSNRRRRLLPSHVSLQHEEVKYPVVL